MANEISIVVRTTDSASRGFGKIGQAATGMNSAIEAAGSALDSLDAIQQSGANKAAARAQAQNDVAQALVDQKQAELDLKQATIDANQATLDASQAQTDYNDAVKEHGANSQEAKQAQADLTQAQYDSAQATADMKQAQVDATQSQIDLNAAQRELNPTLVQQASQRFQELAPALGLAAIAGQTMSSAMSAGSIATRAAALASKAAAGAQWLLNAALSANPIGLVVLAIAALAAGVIYAYKHSDKFRAIVDKAFAVVKAAASSLWNGVRSAFSNIRAAFSSASERARSVAGRIRSIFGGVVTFVRSIPGRVRGALSRIFSPMVNSARDAVNTVRSWLQGLLDFARSIPSRIGGAIKSVIPGFAHGGVVGQAASGGGRSGLTMVGEAGPELLQLPPGTSVRSNPDTRRMMAGGGGQAGGGTFTIIVQGTGLLKGLREVVRVKGGNVQAVLGS